MEDMENIIQRLEEFLCQDVSWLEATMQNLLHGEDLSQILQMTDDRRKVSTIIQKIRTFNTTAWKQLVDLICMNSHLPLDLEVELMSLATDTAEISLNGSFSNEDGHQQRIQDSATRYREQIRHSILEKYVFRNKGDPRDSCNPMFVEPLIKILKVGKKSRIDQKVEKEASSSEEIKYLLRRTSLQQTHVILLIGMPGTGKTMMAHRLCYQWARGEFSQYTLAFLFEFRQLNWISRHFTLRELLFDLFLMPEMHLEEVFEFAIKNPQKVLIIFDGLDEFAGQFTASPPDFTIEADQMTSISNLFTGILYGKVLQGCTIVVTCRSKLFNSLPIDYCNHVAEVLGFNKEKVEQYVDDFFSTDALKKNDVLFYLKDNSNLMHLCFVPALCHVVCVCLEHLLITSVQSSLPQTITQFYIEMLKIFIQSRKPCETNEATSKNTQSLILELAQLAHNGLDHNKTVFYTGEISEEIKKFAPDHGLLSVFEVKRFESSKDRGYSFVHLSSQEFFAALHLITNGTVTQSSLQKRLNLKSKWNLRSKTKEELTDQFHIFLSGLSSKYCQPFLLQLSEHSENLIQKKQVTILESLEKLGGTQLTGPKIIELCYCVYETQDEQLAKRIGNQLANKYDLKNFRITPVDMTAVMYVVKHGSCLVSLDFVGCPMELECLEVLGSCENIESLSFKSKKYGGTFAQALCPVISGMKHLKKIRLSAGCLTTSTIGAMKKAFLCSPALQEINLQGNHLTLKDMDLLLELFSEMKQLQQLDLSSSELNAMEVLSLLKTAVGHHNIRDVQITGDVPTAVFSAVQPQSSPPVKRAQYETTGRKEIRLSLKSCSLTHKNISQLIGILKTLRLSYLNLSGNPLGDVGCKQLIKALPKLHIAGKLKLNKTQISEDGVIHLISSMKSCTCIKKIHASNDDNKAAIHFISAINNDGQQEIRINGFRLQQQQLKKLCGFIKQCSKLTHLDLSENQLENAGISELTKALPKLKSLQLAKLTGNNISLGGILSLTELLSTVEKLTEVDIRFENSQKVMLYFQACKRKDEGRNRTPPPSKSFSLTGYRMMFQKLQRILQMLIRCPHLTHINLSTNGLNYRMMANLLGYLPKLTDLIFLNISKSDLSPDCVLLLADSINLCRRITEVDIRSADNIYLHLQRQPIADKVTCRLHSCKIVKNDLDPLMNVLMKNPNLMKVSMCMNHLSEDGIIVLLAALSSCKRFTYITACLSPTENIHIVFSSCRGSLKTIRLAECRFQAENIKKICSFVHCSDTAMQLKLKRNNMSQQGVKDVLLTMSQMPHESTISIEEPWIKEEDLISLIQHITQTLARIKTLSVLKKKVTIELHGSSENQDGSVPGLRSLRLNHCKADIQNMSFLHPVLGPCLTELDLSDNILNDVGVQALAGFLISLPSLLTIKLANVNMSHTGVTSLLESIRFCRSIVHIVFPDNNIGEQGALAIKNLLTQKRNIKGINVSGCFGGTTDGGRQFIAEVSKCPELQELHLMSLSLDDVSLNMLSQGLAQVMCMKILMLGNNKITSTGIQHLSDSLIQCLEMEALDLSFNCIEDVSADRLAAVLPRLKLLKTISLCGTKMSSQGAVTLFKAIEQCQFIEDINLSENTLEEQSFLKIVEGLQHLTHLRSIHLNACVVSDNVCISLAKALGYSKSIEEIKLSWNNIGDEGACALAGVLVQMESLKILDLEKNQIQKKGAEAMAQALGICPYIKMIRLWNNPVSKSTQEELQKQDQRLHFSFF